MVAHSRAVRMSDGTARIVGAPVAPLFPAEGPVYVLCVGEAPGPRGADKSGIPFFGDRAGLPLYRALAAAGACDLPEAVSTLPWDGRVFAEQQLRPTLHGVALGNAYDRCPTNDGHKFRAPSRAEIESEENTTRIRRDLEHAQLRGLVRVIALGRVAAQVMQRVISMSDGAIAQIALSAVPHPSAQGLLSTAPDRGRGARLADLAALWERDVAELVRASTQP